MNRKNDGVLSRDVYTQKRRYIRKMDRASRPLWQNQGVCLFVTVLLAVMDGINLFSVYDTILYESQAMLWAMTATTAFCLEFFPMLLAVLLRQMEQKCGDERKKCLYFAVAVCIGFFLVFATTAVLRWVSKDVTFAGETTVITGEAGQASLAADTSSPAASALTVLLMVLPLITSIAAGTLSYLSFSPVEKQDYLKKLREVEIAEQSARIQVAQWELTEAKPDDTMENTLFSAAEEYIDTLELESKARADFVLAEYLRTPQALSAASNRK